MVSAPIVWFPMRLESRWYWKPIPNYVGDAAVIPNVIVKYFADPTTMANAVEKGEIDIAWRTLGPVESTRLPDVEGLTVEKVDAPALRYMVFNHTFMVEEYIFQEN